MNRLVVAFVFLISITVKAAIPEVSSGQLTRIEQFDSRFIPSRNIDVWLPPGYDATAKYPVIYMHDGQMLFDESTTWNKQEWHIDEVAGRLITEGKIPPVIIVGVFNSDTHRHSEYFPQKPFDKLPESKQTELYSTPSGEHGKLFNKPVYSDNYLSFLVKEVKPFIEKQFAAHPHQAYLMGSSMGGLISWYGLMEYPEVFKGAACLSTHWPGDFAASDTLIPEQFGAYLKTHLPELTDQRIYFDYGDQTLDALYPPLQRNVDHIFEQSQLSPKQWTSRYFPGENHSEDAWAKRVELPLRFLLTEI